jgi:hypothetical protein
MKKTETEISNRGYWLSSVRLRLTVTEPTFRLIGTALLYTCSAYSVLICRWAVIPIHLNPNFMVNGYSSMGDFDADNEYMKI